MAEEEEGTYQNKQINNNHNNSQNVPLSTVLASFPINCV
jgi:hypothetical protein